MALCGDCHTGLPFLSHGRHSLEKWKVLWHCPSLQVVIKEQCLGTRLSQHCKDDRKLLYSLKFSQTLLLSLIHVRAWTQLVSRGKGQMLMYPSWSLMVVVSLPLQIKLMWLEQFSFIISNPPEASWNPAEHLKTRKSRSGIMKHKVHQSVLLNCRLKRW